MNNKIKLFFFNYSKVFGGQENYLLSLFPKLDSSSIAHGFVGSPLSEFDHFKDSNGITINVLNGNKALYKYCSKPGLNFRSGTIYIQHSSLDDSQGPSYKRVIRKILIYFCLKRVDAVIRVCNTCISDKYAQGKITTVYNGVELKSEVPRNAGKKLNLLMVGAINDNKNQKLAIETLPYINNVTLTLVGSGTDTEALKSLAIELGVSERVSWAGFQGDPTPYYEQADLLLMLSKNEAFPFVVLEAMAQGVPVVAVPVGGVPEAVKHLYNGALLDDYQPQSLVSAIQKIQQDKVLYTTLSENSIATIKNKFSLELMTQGFLAVVNQVLEKRSVK